MIGWTEVIQNIIYFISLYYVIFWMIVLLDNDTKKNNNLKSHPTISIAIPAYNEEDNIIDTLKSVVALDYPKDKIKIFFVDDGSKDRTYERARKFLGSINKKHQYLGIKAMRQPNGGKHTALNNVLKHVDTEFFATLDADSFPNKDALKNIMACFTEDNIAAVSPILKVHKPKNTLQFVQWFEYSVNHFYKSIISNVNAIHVLPGPLSVYRTRVVKEVGCFRSAHNTEDMEIALRIQKKNYRIIQCNDAFVYTKVPYTIKQLYSQRHRWNYGTFRNLIDYRKMMFNKKYGDFGMFQLPVILLSGALGITILGLILYDLIKSIKPSFRMLQLYNYNIIEYIHHMTFNIIWLDIDAKAIITFIGFFIISMIIMWMSLKMYREKYSIKHSASFIAYIFIYYLFLSIVWLGVFKDVITGRETRWKK